MRTHRLTPAAVLLLLAAALVGCGTFERQPLVTEQRTVDDVDAVELLTDGDLTVVLGDAPSLSITAGEAVIARLTSETDAGILRLDMEGEPLVHSGVIRYELTVTSLRSLTVLGSGDATADFSGAAEPSIVVRGSGDVEATGMDAEHVDVTVEGSGDVAVRDATIGALTVRLAGSGGLTIDGTTGSQDVELDGDGDYRADSLRSGDARVRIRGAGDVGIAVSDSLDARIDGSGEIAYDGDPVLTKSISGSGEIRRR